MNPNALLRPRFLLLFLVLALSVTVLVTAAWQTAANTFLLPQDQQFTNAGRQLLSISPDGSQVVYVANNRLNLKALSSPAPRVVSGTDSGAGITNPVFSPDGKSIAYWSADQTLKRVAVDGGTPQTICQAANPYGMSWGSDNMIVFGQGTRGIQRVPAGGGTPETIVTVQQGELAHGPQILPDGDTVLYTLVSMALPPALAWDNGKIVALSLKSKQSKILLEGGSDARYAPTGHLVYANAGRILAVPFNAARVEVTGKPTELLAGVRSAIPTTGTSQFSFSSNGALAYISAATAAAPNRQLAFVGMDGNVKPLRPISSAAFGPRISPNGKQVAYRDGAAIWIADLDSNAPPRRLTTTEPGEAPVWSPDGERIVYISIFNNMEALFWRRSDGTGTGELLTDRARAPESWSAVHQAISYITLVGPSGDAGDYDIWTYSLRDKKAGPAIVVAPSAQSGSRFSPDGRWMAYESNESGRAEVYVEPYPRTGQRFQISKNMGSRPVWSPEGTRLYFDNNTGAAVRMMAVDIRVQPQFTAADPVPLPVTGFVQPGGTIRRQFDIAPDGKQFLMMIEAPAVRPGIQIISNWFDQLRRR